MSGWNITESIAAEIGNGNLMSSAMALSRNIEEIHISELDITQYELVPAAELSGIAHYI